jgi:hypothetical protein
MLCEHDPAKDQLSPISVEGSDRHGIENCRYCLLIMRTMNFVFFGEGKKMYLEICC